MNSYVGRQREGVELRRLLGSGRLVTLVGPGGVGKTRLAVQVMHEVMRAFPDGVVLVELAEVRDGALVPNLVADRLGLHDRAEVSATRNVVDHLRDRATLVVLDNCEHLVEACADLAEAILTGCERLALLATSRQSLDVPGEWVLPVEPLPIEDAVRLFRDRAAAVWPGSVDETSHDALVELCRQLDGLPLAIELAAARVRSLSPEQIVDRLAGRLRLLTSGSRTSPRRQQTLRATLDWSFDLCTPPEQLVWARVSVFAGSFALDAAEQVCADHEKVAPGEVLEVIDSLLDKSVLIRLERGSEVRYQMLETLREYGHERLEQTGEAGRVARLHRDWYDRLTETADEQWMSDRQLAWVTRLRQDHANIRAALDWSVSEPGEAGVALGMASRLLEYWILRGLAGEARAWLEQALAVTPPDHPLRGFALRTCAFYALWLGDLEGMEWLLPQAEAVAAERQDEALTAAVNHVRAFATMLTYQPGAAALSADVCAVHRRRGDVRSELHPLFIHGLTIAYRDGDLAAAHRSLDRMYDLCTAAGEVFYRAMSLFGKAVVEAEFGDLTAADQAATAALRLDLLIGDDHGRAYRVDTLAWIADKQGDHLRAATLFGISARLWDRIGAKADFAAGLPHRMHLDHTRDALGEEKFGSAFAVGRDLSDDDAVHFALREPTAKPVQPPSGPLTDRETQVARLVADGLTNQTIASRLVISKRTADTHVQNILIKLGFTNRAQLAAWVAGGGLRGDVSGG